MDYTTITVHVDESAHSAARIDAAVAIAQEFGAHLIGVGTLPMPGRLYSPGLDASFAALCADYWDAMRGRVADELTAFEQRARERGLAGVERRIQEEGMATGLALQARYSDLLVMGQPDPDDLIAETGSGAQAYLLENAPCPVLFIPYANAAATIGRRPLVAWDGSACAARAIKGALPFLRQTALTQLIVFQPPRASDAHGEEPGADMALFLARHGVRVEVLQCPGQARVGEALLSHLADTNADLLVMGGYGHSHFREWMLGGVTRTLMQSMTVPVLMAH